MMFPAFLTIPYDIGYSPADRRCLLDAFADLVDSSAELSPEVEGILHDVRAFVLSRVYAAPPSIGSPLARSLTTEDHNGDISGLDNHAEETSSEGKICHFNGCHGAFEDTTTAGITNHLLENHFKDNRTSWETSDERVHCLWRDCRCRGTLKKRSLARHIGTTHLKTTEVPCDVPGCGAVLSREDGRKRHMRTVHGTAGTPQD
ncbi:uncharacterized protein C8Q71DRAFT_741581 [Rhodofomes roseus]|uniref:C2H2-type domain-containing protein n=1 Tax=Rhodofomes roseus TaxID=34475 RepID=A0ABQ8KR21_9APHY|nr:uncharacterized protein C8Q71DRAFT_741581 [Rhodofomes roseus]KAH9840837.1 hypothetical protein C8Q71DRAFT_741581 [Rhodofomes roseus]